MNSEIKLKKQLSKLYDYQTDAIKATDKHTIGKVCMPTGTGKTFVQAAMIAKDIAKNNGGFGVYLINAPRIMLSYQLLKEFYMFMVDSNITARYMLVHSGYDNVENDLEEYRIAKKQDGSDMKYSEVENTTSSTNIKSFFDKSKKQNKPLIIVSTYHSVERINTALSNITLNMVLNDEAQYIIEPRFFEVIKNIKSKRCYYFTATMKHTKSDNGTGMNNKNVYGNVLYEMTPLEAIRLGKMVRPRIHIVTSDCIYTDEEMSSNIGNVIWDTFEQHTQILNGTKGKLLVSVKGVDTIENFMDTDQYKTLIKNGVMIYSVASNLKIGNNINGVKMNRKRFLDQLKTDGENPDKEIIILHYDILAEGIDVPGITGIMPLRILGKSKFMQTYGRAARLHPIDRNNITNGIVKPEELNKMIKPYAYVIIPAISNEDEDTVAYILEIIGHLRKTGFKLNENIIVTDKQGGMGEDDPLSNIMIPNTAALKPLVLMSKLTYEIEKQNIANLAIEARNWGIVKRIKRLFD